MVLTCSLTSALQAATTWQTLAPGIDYTTISSNNPVGDVHAFRVNLAMNKITLARAQDKSRLNNNVANLAKQVQGVIAINGGFFDPIYRPLGLRVRDGQLLNPLRPVSWWGIFYIINNHAYISSRKEFNLNSRMTFAVQSGPRLIINGKIPTLKAGLDSRSAIGVDPQGRVIITITSRGIYSLNDLALIMKNQLGCNNALNLDGGSSSQLFSNIGTFDLLIPSLNNVADAVVVVPNKIR